MKEFNVVISVIFVIAVLGSVWTFFGLQNKMSETPGCTMEARVCPDGSAVGRTGPNCEFALCPQAVPTPVTDDVQKQIDAKEDLIVVDSPARDSTIVSPVTIAGKARGSWYFEASFPIMIVDWDGRIIGQGVAQAQGDWMTENFVPFTATISFAVASDTLPDPAGLTGGQQASTYHRGAIILKKDNPSGLPANDDSLEVPVLF